MRTYLSTQGRTFSPEAMTLLVQAFDGAWIAVQRFDGITDENREAIRQTLAKRIVELWDAAGGDPLILRDAALASLNLSRPAAEASVI